jgi:rod shape-determining protein MreD
MYNGIAVIVSLLIALMLALLPMPEWTLWIRPAWVLMVLIYWAMMFPLHVNVGIAWTMGLLLDLINNSLLGEHALAMTIVIYFVSRLAFRLRMYPMLQQGFSVFLFVLMYQFIIYCIQGFIGELPGSPLYWLSSVMSMILWPWLFSLLRDSYRWYKTA